VSYSIVHSPIIAPLGKVENGFGGLFAQKVRHNLIPKLRHFNRELCMCFHTEKTFFEKFFEYFGSIWGFSSGGKRAKEI
jgi:hypothetical protein